MQTESKDWKLDFKHIAKIISKIEVDHAIEQTPNSEDIIQLKNDLFDYLPASIHDAIRYKNAVEKVMDTVEEVPRDL